MNWLLAVALLLSRQVAVLQQGASIQAPLPEAPQAATDTSRPPPSAPALYADAQRQMLEMHFHEANESVESALRTDPYFVPALTLKARLAVFSHRPDVAKSCLIQAVTIDPRSQEAQFFLGVFYYLQNDFKLALSPLGTARTLSPNDPLPVFYLAMSQEALGDAPAALQRYQQAQNLSLAKTSQTAAILVAYGRLLFSLGRYKESIAKDELAIATDDQSRDAHYERAKGLNHEGDYAQAAKEGERALKLPELGTSDSQIDFLLSNVYLKLGKTELAESYMAKFRAAPQSTKR